MGSPKDLKFTKTHEWVRATGDEAVVGITEHAESELGDITYVEIPTVGKEVRQSSPMSTIESVKAASDIYAPVSGTVIAVNSVLDNSPEKVNKSPYEDGWIVRIKMSDPAELGNLMDADAYDALLEESHN
jgi:glycine cleavage system H protein